MKLEISTWIDNKNLKSTSAKKDRPLGKVFVINDLKMDDKSFSKNFFNWQLIDLKERKKGVSFYSTSEGPVWIAHAPLIKRGSDLGNLEPSAYAQARGLGGALAREVSKLPCGEIEIHFVKISEVEEKAFLVGLELAQYYFKQNHPELKPQKLPPVKFFKDGKALSSTLIEEAAAIAYAVNLARHLVNLPPNELHPVSYAKTVQQLFSKAKNTKVEVWEEPTLKKEKMELLLGVGRSAASPPRLVKISYQPKNSKGKPIAFVGKGITFDSGGLDIKPAQFMRLMKKDMGGSAALVGIAWWLDQSGLKTPATFYLSLAENAVDKNSFRPGDIITARNGTHVEIDNTDAEGRLVLADALDVAVTEKGEKAPRYVIDVATLTGAGKVALGADVASLFTNNERLAQDLLDSGVRVGDLCWRLPLFDPYFSQFNSPVADMTNSGGSFAGAITAALFLKKFVREVPWAHFDIYAWADSASDAYSEKGGSGQSVQGLIEFLSNVKS